MIFIIEGPDGSGKTTLANTLSRQTGYNIIHRVQPKTEEDKRNMMDEYLSIIKSGKNAIFDRCWYSEMAYGPVMRDASVISYPEMYKLEELLARNGAIIIYCTDNEAKLWKRCQRRGEDYITDYETFKKICDAFNQIMNVPHIVPVVNYSYAEV